MKKSAAARAITETIAITLFSIFALVFSAQANTIKKDNAAIEEALTGAVPAKTLSTDEAQLMDRLNAELAIDIEALLDCQTSPIRSIQVFNASGSLVKTIEAGPTGLDTSAIPANAGLLMTENGVKYYVIED